ncbi:tyrosine-type recombinase/integrase [Castellaniella defragrans]|uniref:tyrosine-type recombinase/integrase n=1 Tax=Castellaniella defragrans TaxID=75697 RepID=UPI0023F20844|nr:site-specific integrase [Castellaniella defragrans]
MSKITVKELEALSADDDGKILREEGGIVGRVRVGARGITVWFRYDAKLNGKKRDYSLGTWPKKPLADIRAERDRIRVVVADGIDPNAAKKAERIQKQQAIEETIRQAEQERIENQTVKDLFDTWLADGVARMDGNAELKRLFGKDVLPVIGKKPLRELTDKDVLTMLRRVLKRGVTRQAVIVYKDVSQMLAWGEKRQPWRGLMADGNPCDLVDMDKLLPADYETERDRVLSPAEIRELHNIFARMDEAYANADDRRSAPRPVDQKTRIALWLCLSTMCRIGELLLTRWEHVDFDSGVWFIPAANTKGHRGKKQDQHVFLSDFARRQFQALHDLTGNSPWCFPAKNRTGEETHVCLKSISKQVGDRQVRFKNRSKPLKGRAFDNSLVLADGANGEWTPHDLRRTGASMMQGLGVSLDVIDRCQNHLLAGRVRRVYLRYDYEAEKTEAWRKLGERLDAILAGGAEIIEIRATAQ